LYEERKLKLDDSILNYLPEFDDSWADVKAMNKVINIGMLARQVIKQWVREKANRGGKPFIYSTRPRKMQ
jgi:hypothetical protein